mmetsp:Transcript_7042/g.11766  ORF Transcript_7042/g.11766 Transcript_7042/m.11766 type:complete len:267 (-) Transcript_7042:333-1133(-)
MELMHRTAYWSKDEGQVGSVYMAASGSGRTDHCNATDFGKPYSDEDWQPSDANLPNWFPNETALKQWKNKLADVLQLNGAAFADGVLGSYRDVGVAISSFQYSRRHKLWWCKNIYGDNHTATTPNYIFHSKSRPSRWSCEAEKMYSNCAIRFLRKESSVYGRPMRKRNHHPPMAHHMMRAEFFVFHYGMALLDALYTMKKDLKLGTDRGDVVSEVNDGLVKEALASTCFLGLVIIPMCACITCRHVNECDYCGNDDCVHQITEMKY